MQGTMGFLIGLISLLLLPACTTRLGEYTIISTKSIDTSSMASYERGHNRIRGEDKASIIVFVQMGQPNMKEAIDRAIEKTPGAVALLDPVLYQEYWWIPFIYGEMKFVIEGNPLLKRLKADGRSHEPTLGSVDINMKFSQAQEARPRAYRSEPPQKVESVP